MRCLARACMRCYTLPIVMNGNQPLSRVKRAAGGCEAEADGAFRPGAGREERQGSAPYSARRGCADAR